MTYGARVASASRHRPAGNHRGEHRGGALLVTELQRESPAPPEGQDDDLGADGHSSDSPKMRTTAPRMPRTMPLEMLTATVSAPTTNPSPTITHTTGPTMRRSTTWSPMGAGAVIGGHSCSIAGPSGTPDSTGHQPAPGPPGHPTEPPTL